MWLINLSPRECWKKHSVQCLVTVTPLRKTWLTTDLPKSRDLGTTHDRTISEMQNWTLSLGAPVAPSVSPSFLERIIGGRAARRSSGNGSDRRDDFGGRGSGRGGGRDDFGGRGEFGGRGRGGRDDFGG